jgi:hypothetical protein
VTFIEDKCLKNGLFFKEFEVPLMKLKKKYQKHFMELNVFLLFFVFVFVFFSEKVQKYTEKHI